MEDILNEIIKYANVHIDFLTETIFDYIDDGLERNKDFIEELKEQREYWKDIIRIKNNDKTYFHYKDF